MFIELTVYYVMLFPGWLFYSGLGYWSESSYKEQVITWHVSHMFWWQAIGWIAISHDIVALRIGSWHVPVPPSLPPPLPATTGCFLNNRTAVDLLSYQHNFVSFDKAFCRTLPPNTNVINKVTGHRNDDDPVYIKQIIVFVQCLMIAECICAYVYFNYSKTKKVHIHSRKMLAFFYTIMWRVLYI